MTSRVTVTRVLPDDFGLRQYTRRWILHDLIETQKVERVRLSRYLLESIHLLEGTDSERLVIGDESWTCDIHQETWMYTLSCEEVLPTVRNTAGTSKKMIAHELKGIASRLARFPLRTS